MRITIHPATPRLWRRESQRARLCAELTSRRIVVWGGGMFAPFVTVWFKTLERVPIKGKTPAALTKACLDQFVAAPAVLSTFFCVMTLMEGKTVEDAKKKWETVSENQLPVAEADDSPLSQPLRPTGRSGCPSNA